MVLKLRAKARQLQSSLHRRCALFNVRARGSPSLPQHVDRADNVGVFVPAAGSAAENRLLRPIAFVARTAHRARAAGIGRGHLYQDAAGLRQLPFHRLPESVEARSKNGPVQSRLLPDVSAGAFNRSLGALRHVLRLQIFRIYAAVHLRERTCGFLIEVLTNAAHSPEKLLNLFLEPTTRPARLGFVERLGQLLFCKLFSSGLIERQLPLQLRNPLFYFFKPVGVEIEEPAAARCYRMNDADVDADIERFHVGDDDFKLRREHDEPSSAILVHVNLLHRPGCERSVRVPEGDRPRFAVAHPADFRELYAAVSIIDIAGLELRYAEAVADVPGLEFRPFFAGRIVLRPETVPDGSVEIPQRLLKRLRHRLFEKSGLFSLLPAHQFGSQLAIVERLQAFGLPLVLQLKRLVEHKAAASGVPAQCTALDVVREEFKFEAAENLHDAGIMAHLF